MGCIFAALLLHGNGESKVEITSDKLLNVLRAARIDPNPFFTNLYANVLQEVDIKELALSGIGGGSSGPVSNAPTGSAPVTETKQEAPKEEPKKVEKDEESASIGGLFGDDD